jgi:hypothetical protein
MLGSPHCLMQIAFKPVKLAVPYSLEQIRCQTVHTCSPAADSAHMFLPLGGAHVFSPT